MLRKFSNLPAVEWIFPLDQEFVQICDVRTPREQTDFELIIDADRKFSITGSVRHDVGYISFLHYGRRVNVANSLIIKHRGHEIIVDVDSTKHIVGIEFLDSKLAINDMCRTLLQSRKFRMDAYERKALPILYGIWYGLIHELK